ncbi:MAG: GGDEF domain-containing protein [Candidatus Margulisiibacteriota bacterium]
MAAINARNRLIDGIARRLGVKGPDSMESRALKRKIRGLIPSCVSRGGQIAGNYIQPICIQLIALAPETQMDAAQLVALLRADELVSGTLDENGLYQAMLREQARLHAGGLDRQIFMGHGFVQNGRYHINNRLAGLQKMILELGNDVEANREIAMRNIRGALGVSGVRVYTINTGTKTWQHRLVEGEEGTSRFTEPAVPQEGNEKDIVSKLLFKLPSNMQRLLDEGLIEVHINRSWGYCYIKDRSKCNFADDAQLRRDEFGDIEQRRVGYGEGNARELIYVFFGGEKDEEIEVYLLTNWAVQKPLFVSKKADLELLHAFSAIFAKNREAAVAYKKMEEMATKDGLTGLNNRKYFEGLFMEELERAVRFHQPLSFAMIDIDHFKQFNDQYGHPFGDAVLRMVAQTLKGKIRNIDTIGRYGGEEFGVILPNAPGENAKEVGERMRSAIERLNIPFGDKTVAVKVSIGVATISQTEAKLLWNALRGGNMPFEQSILIEKADEALYAAKHGGRNQVKAWDPSMQKV